MNPLRVQAQNYRSFASLDLELPTGCVAVVGENGAGKSSIVNLIDLALFGARSLSEYLSDDADDEEMVIGLEFEHRGALYRIRRTYSGRGRGKSSLDFEHRNMNGLIPTFTGSGQANGQFHASDSASSNEVAKHEALHWTPLTRENAAATQQLIEQTIGLSRETFRASAFLAQGDGAAFTEAQPRDRKAILCEVLGLDVWDRLHERARREITTIHDQTSRLSVQVEEADRELEKQAELDAMLSSFEGAVALTTGLREKAEADHKEALDNLNSSREYAAALEGARQVLASRERECEQLRTRRRQVDLALEGADELPKLKAESETLAGRKQSIEDGLTQAREGEKTREEYRRLKEKRDRVVDEANEYFNREAALRAKAGEIEQALVNDCDRCGQPLHAEARARALDSIDEEARAAFAEGRKRVEWDEEELTPRLLGLERTAAAGPNAAKQAELEAALRLANEAEKTLAGIAEREKNVEGLRAEQTNLTKALPELENLRVDAAREVRDTEAKVGPLEDYERAVATAYGVLHEARNAVEGAKQRLAVAEAEIERLTKIEARATENRAALAAHQAELDLLHLAERAYGRDGIPALIIENAAIPQIEAEASRILSELGADLRVELRTQRELKSRDGLREALDIIVCSAAGERPYETFSGGERTRLNLALRIALARLLAHRRGAEVRMLAIDEPDGLDAAGFAALSSILAGMGGDFDKVLVISHHPDLQTAFDQTLVVEKEDGRSRVAGAAVAETVLA